MKRVFFKGLAIDIEYRKGETKPDENYAALPGSGYYMYADYGYIINTTSMEQGEELDVFLGDGDEDTAYLVYLLHPDGTTNEVKVFLGYDNEEVVKNLAGWQYSPDRIGPIVAISIDDFKEALRQQEGQAEKDLAQSNEEPDEDEEPDEELDVEDPTTGEVLQKTLAVNYYKM